MILNNISEQLIIKANITIENLDTLSKDQIKSNLKDIVENFKSFMRDLETNYEIIHLEKCKYCKESRKLKYTGECDICYTLPSSCKE